MILNMSGGGGSGLNFKVVCSTTEPENPKPNTIWVYTSTPLAYYSFRVSEPSTTEDGYVWIKTATSSDAWFNALKKNTLVVAPVAVYQYLNGNFGLRVAYIYKDGAWVQFSTRATDVIVYDSGDTNVSLTLSNVTQKTTCLLATLDKNESAYVRTALIDITHHTTAKVVFTELTGDGSFSGHIRLDILDSAGDKVASTSDTKDESGTLKLDISKLEGSHRVRVYMWNTSGSYAGSCKIKQIEVLL